MLAAWKRRIEEKKAKEKAIAESRYWRTHPRLQGCLQAMRGSCTVAPVEMHEAAIAAVNIALGEDILTTVEAMTDVPEDFMPEAVFLVWDDERLPVMKALWVLARTQLQDVRAVSGRTFLVSENLERILSFDAEGRPILYSIT